MAVQRRLLDRSGRVLQVFNYDHSDGRAIIHTHEDVEPAMDAVREIRNGDRRAAGVHMKMLGSIPVTIINKWRIDDGVDVMRLPRREFFAYVRRKLNGDYSRFRTRDKPL